MRFKVGDFVRCINDLNNPNLKKDNYYTITRVSLDLRVDIVQLCISDQFLFAANRFELVRRDNEV